ncbi:MAG: COX15/CtaA family protein [Candidatus Acidiferrales bacterium]
MARAYHAGLHRFAVFTAACTLLLVVAGALVTSNDAGLAVPDWPLSYGSLMPPMVGGIFYEHGHRMVATFVGMLTIVLAIWIQRREPRRWMRRLGWIALAAVVAQGMLGGLTVLLFLPPPISIAHASLAQLFFCATVGIAVFTSRWWSDVAATLRSPLVRDPPNAAQSDAVRNFAIATTAVVFIQLVLGAAFRHRVLGILPHILWAVAVLLFSVMLSRKVRRHFAGIRALRRPTKLLASLVGTQILLGTAAYLSRVVTADAPQPMPWMVGFTVAHVAVGALTLAAAVVAALCCFRVLPPAARVAPVAATFRSPLALDRANNGDLKVAATGVSEREAEGSAPNVLRESAS